MIMQLYQPSELTEGIITDKTILFLRRMFSDPERYRYYMNTLIIMRRMIVENMASDGVNIDKNHEQFPIFETLNELIGVLESGRNKSIDGLMIGY